MAHDVFISHAHKDKLIAHDICEKLESARIKCWIAERDIPAGEDWTEATRKAIGSSQVIVLLLSENANAAAHMEREMAHAFYTKRVIIQLRLTETLPRRDFLFYLGTVRSFDAFGLPAEGHLEAFTAAIRGLIPGRSPARDVRSFPRAKGAAAASSFSESWIGALQASHYGTLKTLKRIGIVASLVTVGWLFWFAYQQNESETAPGESHSRASQSASRASTDGSSGASEGISESKPAYAFTRFGLWVPSSGAKLPVQQGTREPPGVAQGAQPATNSTPDDRPRARNRREGTHGRLQSRGHEKRVSGRLARRIARIRARMIAD